MSVVFSKPQNRLAWRAGRTGVSRAQAVDQAKVHVEELRQPTIAYIDENLKVLFFLFAHTEGPEAPPYSALYDASNAIAGTASLFGLESLGIGALSLCELLAHLEEQTRWNAPAVKVHLESLSLMREFHTAASSNESNLLLNNLAQLLNHMTSGTPRSLDQEPGS
jgi:hypothetical protein